MTSELNTTFGHRPIYICGEAATTISHFSFLISHSSKAFIRNPWAPPPHGLTLNPPTFLHSFFEIHGKILYNKTLEYNQAQKTNFCEAKKEGYHVSH